MPSWDYVRSPAAVHQLLETGADHGVDPARLLRGSGLTEPPDADVEAGQELQVARNLVEALGDPPGLGVDAGRRTSLVTLGVWSFAVLSSPTWGEALMLGLRFAPLSSAFLRPELAGDARELRIVLHDDELPPDVRAFFAERDLAAVATLVPAIAGSMPPGRLETSLTGDRARALGALVPPPLKLVTGAPGHSLTAAAALLTTPLPQADAGTRRAMERECERLLDARQARSGTAARVRGLLVARPDAMPSMSAVAGDLHLDVRTLRRRLAAEDTSYRALRDEVSETLALELLRTVGLSVGEVAQRLGYSDATAFTHAFSRWTGKPPSAFR